MGTAHAARLALGTMMFGAWGNSDVDECVDMVRDYVDAQRARGLPALLDTADVYDRGRSEEITGLALRTIQSGAENGDRPSVLVATKVGNPMADPGSTDYVSKRGLSRRWIRESCHNSLRRLGVERIDLYQMHRPDPDTPLIESVAAMHQLITDGAIAAWGTSTFGSERIEEIHRICRDNGFTPPSTEQPPYSILTRDIENSLVGTCLAHGMSLLTWAPLNGGWLTGKYDTDPHPSDRAVREAAHFDYADEQMRERKRSLVTRLRGVADAAGMNLTEMAVRFTISSRAVGACLLGPRTHQQLIQLLTIAPEPLPTDVLSLIDDIVAPGTTVNPRDNQ